jgi:hypothetical protein
MGAMSTFYTNVPDGISGEAPNAFVWGSLNAAEFLRIVHDVTCWALTNFEAFRARPAAEELPSCIRGTGTPYFGKSYRLQRPFDSNSPVRTLSSVNDPTLRRPALWWARTFCCASPIAAAIETILGFPLGNGICSDLGVRPACSGSENAWQIGPRTTFVSIGLLLNRCFGRVNETAKRKVSS